MYGRQPEIKKNEWMNIWYIRRSVAVLGLSVWEGGSGGHSSGLGAFNRNNYKFPTTNHTMQVFGSDA